jgi:hypothetical protein
VGSSVGTGGWPVSTGSGDRLASGVADGDRVRRGPVVRVGASLVSAGFPTFARSGNGVTGMSYADAVASMYPLKIPAGMVPP